MAQIMLAKIVSTSFRKSLDKLAMQELPVKAMFQLKGIVKQLRDEMEKWDDIQTATARKWSKKDLNDNPILKKREGNTSYYEMDRENMIQFAAEMGELAKVEVTVRDMSIGDLGSAKLTTDDLVELEFLIE